MTLKVMISSTALDLPEHRRETLNACLRAGMLPLAMEAMPASDADALAESVRLVDDADIYVGILGHRYGHVPKGQDKSITHLEYERAIGRSIPVLMFLIHREHQLTIDDIETERAEELRRLKEEIGEERVVAYFKSPEDLRGHVLHALDEQRTAREGRPQHTARGFHYISAIPAPPEPYIAHPYTLLQTTDLIGRRAELARLTDWVTRPENEGTVIFCLVALGGMGKSALSWKWFRDIAPQELPDLDGRLWWSFYESDATYEAFVTRALAYVTGRPDDEVREVSLHDRETALLNALDRGRFLVVLDGLERLLIAYSRMDAAYLQDDELDAETANFVGGVVGLPASAGETVVGRHRLRKTAEIRAGRFLDRLRMVRGSKVLVSTRLYPSDLQAGSGRPLPGCAALFVEGLAETDALELWRAYGARGSRATMAPYFKSFGNHPLLIQVLGSEVAEDREARGDFDTWRAAHPDFDPFALPLAKARTHVMEHALAGLDEVERRTLQVIAGFRMPCSLDTLNAVLVDTEDKSERGGEKDGPDRAFESLAALDATLTLLEDRGLVGWDRRANRYDLHPIVRGVVWAGLEPDRQNEVYESLEIHFRAIPAVEENEVERLEDLTPAIELYHTIVSRQRYDDAIQLFRDRLDRATLYRLSAGRARAEMLERLFPGGVDQPPRLGSKLHQGYALNSLALSNIHSGSPGAAVDIYRRAVAIREGEGDRVNLWINLSNLSEALCQTGRIHEAESVGREALGINREAKDLFGEGVSLYLIGLTLGLRGASTEAAVSLQRSLRIWVAQTHRQFEGHVSSHLAQFEAWKDNPSETAGYADRAWGLAGVKRYERDFLRAARLQGTAALLAGDIDRAAERLEHALTRARAVDLFEESLPALAALAEIARRRSDPTRARDLLADVWEAAERGPYPTFEADARLALARIEQDAGDRDAVVAAATRAFELAWCDGPPFAYHWGLEKARALLVELEAPIPDLPPFDPSKFDPMPEVELDPPDDPIEEDEP